ncbi:helix-turn-helix domain-containing protein [Microbacterium sp. LMC-P-041]|uniref:GlxA family transcriptional regulator n=1 Tax=Microbacterium sp. LMC-P-041 TaxID=3040293 RepID=UPI002555F88A|nr:helix-turn-helix domain-containing protein [Microbacterium sp. LMC-P-041]
MKIAIYAFPGVTMFHLSVPQMVFDEVSRLGLAEWSSVLFSERGGSVRSSEGYSIGGVHPLSAVVGADLIVIPSWVDDGRVPSAALRKAVVSAHADGAVVAGLCLGAIAVADIGLLRDRSAVTHWRSLSTLAERHPQTSIETDVLYIDHGDVLTSAGTASGLDACLHLVRQRLGAEAANRVARSLVVAPHREGGQAQYIERPVAIREADDPIATASDWALAHLDEDLTIDALARAAHMSRRSFVRAFHASTGSTPAAWVRSRRLDEARRLLEVTSLSIDQIAASCGFGSPITLRQNFLLAFGSTPSSYRHRFGERS